MDSSGSVIGQACLARQPIYDADLAVCGYELLYRPAQLEVAGSPSDARVDDSVASAATLTAALTDLGLDAVVGNRRAWVNVGHAFLLEDLTAVLPADRVVIEILESVLPEQQVVDAVAKLRGDGYTVALDDFVHDETLEPLIALADVIKIDVLTASPEQIRQQVDVLAAFPGTLLAEKVETHETLEHCRRLGFELFQGYALEKPRLVTGARVSAEASIRMQLVARLNEPGVGFDELARLIQADLALSYRLLRFVNSAHVGLRRQVESIKDALIVLGQRTIRSWATLLLLSDVDTNRHELVVTALGRAHTCEHLARSTGEDADGAFLVGLLSVADALLDRPLDEIAGELPISARLRGALLERDGPLGDLLARSLAYEQGDFTTALAAPLDPPTVSGAYLEGIAAAARLIGLRMEL